VYERQRGFAGRAEEGIVGQDEDGDSEFFVPLRLFYGDRLAGRREQERDRRMAVQVDRRRQHGGRPAPRARGLSRADIVGTAVAVADAEGTDAISIRRLARELRVGPMSLYWYVSSTEELHQLMLEVVQAEIEAPEPSGDWRADARVFAASTRAALLRHPWAIDFLGGGPPSGPNDARNGERLLAAFDGLGLDLTTTMWALMTIGAYVMGAALRDIQEARWHRSVAAAMTAMSEDEAAALRGEFERRIRASGKYPHLVRFIDEDIDPDAPETRDERFEFGLSLVLDGIAARIRS
jgi:AcrR family transcriptional regulator